MTAPSTKRAPVGFKHCNIYALDGSGYPAASSTTVYEGIVLEGAKELSLNDPTPRFIHITGDDRVMALDILPPLEAMTATLVAARIQDALSAILTGLKSFTVGEAKGFLGGVTDLDGLEAQCCVFAYAQATDETGARIWDSIIMPKAVLVPQEAGYGAADQPRNYTIAPQLVTKHIWGTALVAGTEGGVQTQIIRFATQYKPWLVAWKGDNMVTKFLFSATKQAVSVDKIHGVWVNGVLDATATKATDGVTPTAKPGDGDMIVCFYETA